MFCPNCGKELTEKSKFCVHCGKSLENVLSFGTIQLRCKSCNGLLTVDEGKKVLSCPYCQSQELIVESEEVIKQRIQSDAFKDVETLKQETYREIELAKQNANREMEQMRQKASRDIEQMRQKAYRDVEIAKTKSAKVSDPYMNTIKITLLGALFIALAFLEIGFESELSKYPALDSALTGVTLVLLFLGVGLIVSARRRRRKLNEKGD